MSIRDQSETVLVAGPAGSGKSVLGTALAREVGAALLDLDTLTNPLLEGLAAAAAFGDRHWNDPALRPVVRPARYAALREAIAAQPCRVVAVAPWTVELAGGPEWAELAEALGGAPRVAWLRADARLLAARRAGRGLARDAHIVEPPAPPAVAHIEVDASQSAPDQVAALRAALGW